MGYWLDCAASFSPSVQNLAHGTRCVWECFRALAAFKVSRRSMVKARFSLLHIW